MKLKVISAPPVQALAGGYIKQISHNPVDGGTFQSVGNSHERGGIPVDATGNGKPDAEIEGGESIHTSPFTGEKYVGGNLFIPGTKTKFKTAFKKIGEEEVEATKTISKAGALVEKYNPENKYGILAHNAARVMSGSAQNKQKALAATKEQLAQEQQGIHELADQLGMDPKELNKSMKFGGKLPQHKFQVTGLPEAKSGWKFNGTKRDGLDGKIEEFVKLLEQKGLTGYSGPNSGVDARNTKSGRLSRHTKGQALDMFFDDKEKAYETILSDPDLAGYMYQHGLTAINEYDPKVAKGTGATAGHLHIGYDRGTPTADAFRKAAATRYPNWDWSQSAGQPFRGNNRAQMGLPVGDGQNLIRMPEPNALEEQARVEQEFPIDRTPALVNPNVVEMPTRGGSSQQLSFPTPPGTQRGKSLADSNKLGIGQFLPEIAALGDRPDFVQNKHFTPTLYQPYNVSFQDRLNENNASFKSISSHLTNNPEALSILAAQKYGADNAVSAEQFRTNQGIDNQVTNQNIGLINDARMKNLALDDQQFVRQTQARENTRANQRAAVNSIFSKIGANKLENNNIRMYENMFGYRWNSATGKMEYMGPAATFNTGGMPVYDPRAEVIKTSKTNADGETTTINTTKTKPFKKWGGKMKRKC